MKLDEALRQIAAAGNLDADQLIRYAAEDYVGGRDTGAWSGMSTFESEGKILYALVRALRPDRIVEVGVDSGGTSTHLLSALEANNNGALHSVDIKADCGINVPQRLRHRWSFNVGDALTIDLPEHADFIFEDGSHALDFTTNILRRLKTLGARVIISHDYFTHEVYGGFYVKQAFDAVLPGGLGVKVEGAFAGLGVWFNPEWKAPETYDWLLKEKPEQPPILEPPTKEEMEQITQAVKVGRTPRKPAAKTTKKAAKRG